MPGTTAVSELNPFEHSNLLTAERGRLLARTAETLAEHMEEMLSHRLSDCTVRSETIEQIMLPEPFDNDSDLAILKSEMNLGHGSISTDLKLAMPIVAVLLGGAGDPPAETRALTRVEAGVMDLLLSPITTLAAGLFDLGPMVVANHVASAAVAPEVAVEPALMFPFHLTVGSLEGTLSVLLSGGLLQPFIEKLDRRLAGRTARKEAPDVGIVHTVQHVPVEVIVGFDLLHVPAGQLADLKVGDVLRTGQLVSKSLVARVGAEQIFNVRAAQRGQRLVAELTSPLMRETGVT